MKKEIISLSALMTTLVMQAEELPDSLKQVNLNEIIVSATRVNEHAPIAFNNVSAQEIKANNTAKNIPYILQTLPSIVAYSEDGSGVGNTSFRIRGTDATRINVTLNGMPLNNPESQEVYWVNIPDLSNSLQSIQVQRGVGSSTNGSGAFGASISLKTQGTRPQAYGEASTGVGSYNTFTSTIAAGTGILKNGLSFDARYSRVTGDGYIRNGKVNHRSAYASASYYNKNQLFKLSYLNGIQHTGITWEGISPEQLKTDRKYNPAGAYYDEAGNVHYYENETDNYYSDIIQFTYSNALSDKLSLNVGLSYNHGYGYYENYKADQKFKKYGLDPQLVNDSTYKSSDVITRKLMKNNFYVGNFTLNYISDKLTLTGGGNLTSYQGDHYGKLLWVKYNKNISDKYEWYRGDADKKEFSVFGKITYNILDNLAIFGDMQYRYIDYRMSGIDDDLENITNKNYYSFFNPKAGLSYSFNNNEVYASLSISNREPLRTDIKESVKGGSTQKIQPERMFDYELGYRYSSAIASFNANLYYMKYKDQMVQTGKLNDVGYKLMENVPTSYRMGIELSGAVQPANWIRIDANVTLSQNKIKNYTAYYDLYNNQNDYEFVKQTSEYLGTTNISFSPNVIGSGILTITPYKALSLALVGKYVGKQYYDNTSNKDNRLADYFVSNIVLGYTFKTQKIGEVDIQFSVNNILNKRYVGNAWVATDKFEDGSEIVYTGLYPQATRNIMAKLGIRF
ncbi:TonB-dependent receptor [Dysgonomonas capnocytophagoides]|uniref:TonB-dependent receptor n=1 Tax=Dysgonomonas capnocytophagoides TaxID=45254 RepID=A0A4Y8L8M3_9BACT|nr:TonB-dependent receptor [Dysgonomonas capnocytophagoides]TFD98677.1 TonB-dependent receptor [Dysgonomonas capnocytophagoides]